MVEGVEDLHQMDPDAFREHVRSFQFWLDAVEGYLEGTEYGHAPTTAEAELDEDERENLVTVLCSYCVGETAALEGAGGLIAVAPNRPTKIFLSTQTVDEGRHLEVLVHRLRELGVEDPEAEIARRASPKLFQFKERLLDFVRGGDWDAALFAQNVVLEAMEFAVFHRHARTADPRTREVLEGIIKDERRHIGFGENEVGRRLRESPGRRKAIARVKSRLDSLVLETFEATLAELDIPRDRRPSLGRDYMQAVGRLGVSG